MARSNSYGDRWRVVRRIGRGGQGTVYEVEDTSGVLGDCGLAIKLEKPDRLTMSFENVGTRDYQPPWSYEARLEDVRPTFDVFSLAKLIWAAISGKPRFPLWDFEDSRYDLRQLLPGNADVIFVHRVFEKCLVRDDAQCTLRDGGELLRE